MQEIVVKALGCPKSPALLPQTPLPPHRHTSLDAHSPACVHTQTIAMKQNGERMLGCACVMWYCSGGVWRSRARHSMHAVDQDHTTALCPPCHIPRALPTTATHSTVALHKSCNHPWFVSTSRKRRLDVRRQRWPREWREGRKGRQSKGKGQSQFTWRACASCVAYASDASASSSSTWRASEQNTITTKPNIHISICLQMQSVRRVVGGERVVVCTLINACKKQGGRDGLDLDFGCGGASVSVHAKVVFC